jgi:hypothetical protein
MKLKLKLISICLILVIASCAIKKHKTKTPPAIKLDYCFLCDSILKYDSTYLGLQKYHYNYDKTFYYDYVGANRKELDSLLRLKYRIIDNRELLGNFGNKGFPENITERECDSMYALQSLNQTLLNIYTKKVLDSARVSLNNRPEKLLYYKIAQKRFIELNITNEKLLKCNLNFK